MNEEIEISILGSTGSIGLNTISVIRANRAYSSIKFCALTGNNNIDQLVKVAKSLKPKFVASANPEKPNRHPVARIVKRSFFIPTIGLSSKFNTSKNSIRLY